MAISAELNSSFEKSRPNNIISAEKARQLLLQFNLWDEIANKVAEIIMWENSNDVFNPKVIWAIENLSKEVNRWNSKNDVEQIINNISV